MTFQFLVSVLNCNDINKFINEENINADAIIINQCDKNNIYEIHKEDFTIKVIETTERGLSKSRNLAIKHASADVCLICDDDEVFFEDTKDKIIKTFEENKEVDAVRFAIEGIEKVCKKYKQKPFLINIAKSGEVSSYELAFRLKSIKDNKIVFDEDFGAGSGKYISGEENIFIAEVIKKGLIVKYFPTVVAKMHVNDISTWFKGYNCEFFETKGAFFERLFPKSSKLLSFLFLIKPHRQNLLQDMSFVNAYKSMLKGIKKFRNENRKRDI